MNEQFYASIKMVTGEEVLARCMKTVEGGEEIFLLDEPIIVSESTSIDKERNIALSGLVPKKWMTYGGDGLVIVYKHHIISISEMDRWGAEFYEKALLAARVSSPIKKKVHQEEHSGYLGSADDYRDYLEEMYNNSPDIP
jgi:hypothetical protein